MGEAGVEFDEEGKVGTRLAELQVVLTFCQQCLHAAFFQEANNHDGCIACNRAKDPQGNGFRLMRHSFLFLHQNT